MKILIATDAWHPQVNGVVRTLTSLAKQRLGAWRRHRLPHPGRISVDAPCRPIRACASRCRTGARSRGGSRRPRRTPSTSRPRGRSAGRCAPIAAAASLRSPRPTRRAFPNMSRSAPGSRASVGYAVLRHFHAASSTTMVATNSLRQELSARGFRKLGFWTRGVDTELFHPHTPATLDLPRPIFMTMGRVAVEKISKRFCRSTCRARRWWSATDRRRRSSQSNIPARSSSARRRART